MKRVTYTYDPLVADALVQGYRMPGANRADVAAAVQILTERGYTADQIAFRLDITTGTVEYGRRLRLEVDSGVESTYSGACNCEVHEYDTKRSLYNRDRKACTT